MLGWRTPAAWWRGRLAERRARRRAEDLVRHMLSDGEYAQLCREGFIELRSRRVPGRRYRIPAGGSPVAALEPDGRLVYLCLQPVLPVPRQELLVIQKLLLEGTRTRSGSAPTASAGRSDAASAAACWADLGWPARWPA